MTRGTASSRRTPRAKFVAPVGNVDDTPSCQPNKSGVIGLADADNLSALDVGDFI